jgi:uncharacterized protein YneF (UPF0154 family)
MNKKTQTILIVITSILALGGLGYFIYSKYEQKRMAKIYEKSIEDMANKYGKNLFN